jgi:hypothetical protein
MYPHFNIKARDMITFMELISVTSRNLFINRKRLSPVRLPVMNCRVFHRGSFEKDYRLLVQTSANTRRTFRALVNAYKIVHPHALLRHHSLNPYFGDVEETEILVTNRHIYDYKIEKAYQSPARLTNRLLLRNHLGRNWFPDFKPIAKKKNIRMLYFQRAPPNLCGCPPAVYPEYAFVGVRMWANRPLIK